MEKRKANFPGLIKIAPNMKQAGKKMTKIPTPTLLVCFSVVIVKELNYSLVLFTIKSV